jgi:hypothetical protein
MLREEKVRQLAEAIKVELGRNRDLAAFEIPNREWTIAVHGNIDLLVLAEWFYVRMG